MLDRLRYENIPLSYYQGDDVVKICRELIGMVLFHQSAEGLVGGRIVETEAYNGRTDKASHAYHRRTKRTEVMYEQGGCAYIYLCYGIHHLFNIVTNVEGYADAVLIRAIEPMFGIDLMRARTGKGERTAKLASGPGLVGKSMGFRKSQTGQLLNDKIWIGKEKNGKVANVEISKRIGVDYAEEDADLPWRFMLKGSGFVSRK
ncbi:MAG: DNA-3-methyladenine glycosylase [Cytophagales bacterium]|nr:DNA-3-methyladenine glycosylase [Cytophagales bacterium]